MPCHRHPNNQLSFTNTLIIPDNKPDIQKVLRVTSTPVIMKISTIAGKVIVTGKINTFVEYVACSYSNNQPLHFSEFEIPFTHFIEHRCVKAWQDANVSVCVEFQEAQVINRRTISIFLILKAFILRLHGSNIVVRTHICPSQNILHNHSGETIVCPQANCTEDCSAHQPCSAVICNMEYE